MIRGTYETMPASKGPPSELDILKCWNVSGGMEAGLNIATVVLAGVIVAAVFFRGSCRTRVRG